MCGRYRRTSDKQRIAEAFQVTAGLEILELEPDDDVRPQSMQPVVYLNEHGERTLELMRWGFKLSDRLLFNARSEGVEAARFWRESFQKRRCIVPADGIFEWQKLATGPKPKFEFTLPGRRPFGMAGVWNQWKNPKTGQWERTFAVLTGESNEVTATVHDRLTTILDPADYTEYLEETVRPPTHLLRIAEAAAMRVQEAAEGEPVTGSQPTLFDCL